MTNDGNQGNIPVGTLSARSQVVAASLDSGRALLTTPDTFVASQSRFDRQARTNLRASTVSVTESIYLDYVNSQVMPWSQGEIDALKRIIATMAGQFDALNLDLPETIYLVKTSGQEEGFAAYTRRLDVIALPANMVASLETAPNYGDPLHPAQSLTYLQDTITHECFHLFSKNNPERREKLYSLIHYRSTGQPVVLPPVSWPTPHAQDRMPDLKITNPDAPVLDVYIELEVPEDPNGPSSVLVRRPLLPVLLANGPYQGGIFFEYLQWYFLAIAQDHSGQWQPVMGPDGRPLLYLMSPTNPQLWNQYLDLVGHNVSGELFHPDEVLAQNFVFVANLPTLGLLSGMKDIMAQVGVRI